MGAFQSRAISGDVQATIGDAYQQTISTPRERVYPQSFPGWRLGTTTAFRKARHCVSRRGKYGGR